jgi:hypothetical protein
MFTDHSINPLSMEPPFNQDYQPSEQTKKSMVTRDSNSNYGEKSGLVSKTFMLAEKTDKKVGKILNGTYNVYGFAKEVVSSKAIQSMRGSSMMGNYRANTNNTSLVSPILSREQFDAWNQGQ